MRAVILMISLAALSACGVPPEEDISARGEFSPLQSSYFVPVTDTTREALENSDAWAETLASYR